MLLRRLGQIGRTVQNLQRFRDIVRIFLKYGYEDMAIRLHLPKSLGMDRRLSWEAKAAISALSGPEKLRHACEELGPTFVKMGQVLSTRTGVLPEGYADELIKLQDQVAPISFAEVKRVLEAELKRPLTEVFASIDETPLGAASIGQVHRARLHSGAEVVVKVQRPGIRQIVETDLEIMAYIAGLMENHLDGWKVHRPTRVVEELARSLKREIDFTIEAAHIERFAWQFAGEPSVYVPALHRELSSRHVLTMEYVDGIKASRIEELDSARLDPVELARRVTDLVMKQIFVHGFFHADPHPGNIHILPGQRICFLDFGMMGFVDRRSRELFADLVWGIARRNEISVANTLLRLASSEPATPRDGFQADVAEFIHQHFYRPMGEIEFGSLVTQLLRTTGKHGLRLPPDIFIMLKALSLTEGLVRRLDPKLDLMTQATPFIKEARMLRVKPGRVLEGFFEFGLDVAELARGLPGELRRIMSQFKTGETRVIFKHDGLEPMLHSWDQISNRLSFSIVLAALIVGSSLIIHAGVPPKWFGIPAIGLIGFVLAAFMGFWLLISILRHGRM